MMWCHACAAAFDSGVCPRGGWCAKDVDGVLNFAPDYGSSGQGYDPTYDHEMARLEIRHFWFRARNQLIVRAMHKYLPASKSFMEIGCGTGMVLTAIHAAFPAMVVSGSELFAEGLHFARQRLPDARLMQMDATRIPFADEFDAIGAFDVLEHIRDDVGVLDEIHRALCRDGGVIATVPQHPWLWSQQDELAHHVRRYRRGELEGKLRQHGFRVVYSTSFITTLLPLLVLSRRAMRHHDEDPFHELRIGGIANAMLGAALKPEIALLGAGAHLPVGGSRLIVALKETR